MHFDMFLILPPIPTPSFPRLPSPRYKFPNLRQGVLCTIGDLSLLGTWVYRGLGAIGGFVIGEKVIGKLGLGVHLGSWVYRGLGTIVGFVIGEKVIGDVGLSGSWD